MYTKIKLNRKIINNCTRLNWQLNRNVILIVSNLRNSILFTLQTTFILQTTMATYVYFKNGLLVVRSQLFSNTNVDLYTVPINYCPEHNYLI